MASSNYLPSSVSRRCPALGEFVRAAAALAGGVARDWKEHMPIVLFARAMRVAFFEPSANDDPKP